MSSGMTNSKVQQQAFQARLNRIREKQGQPPLPSQAQREAQLAAEAAAAIPQPKAKGTKPVSPIPSVWENLGYPMSILGAFLLGMLAVFAARYARFHIMGGSMVGEDADIAMMIDGGLAMGVGFLFRSMFNFQAKEFVTAKTFGIVAMICVMHNLVHWAPEAFAVLFDVDYVLLTLEMTEPNSILFRGVSFVLVEPESAQAAAPTMPTYFHAGQ